MVLSNKTHSYIDTNGIKTLYQSPVIRWKNLIGNKDPLIKTNPETLRTIYGTDIIRNEFWGSDTVSDAFRELSIFHFPIPVKVKIRLYIFIIYSHPISPTIRTKSNRLQYTTS